MRLRPRLLLALALLLLPAIAGAGAVETSFFGSFPISEQATFAWGEGTPAPSFDTEATLRGAVEAQLEKRGYEKSATQTGDLVVITRALRDPSFPMGQLLVEIRAGSDNAKVWQGQATEVFFGPDQTPKKIQKRIRRAVKDLFSRFPERRR